MLLPCGGVPALTCGWSLVQGALNDCYFLCAVSALAEFEHKIKRLFIQDRCGDGKYTVRWWHDGEPIEVVVDDYFPCDPDTGEPAFSSCVGSELWVCLLEKAWAKKHGSYQQIESGHVGEVLSAFTGAPERNYKLKVRPGCVPWYMLHVCLTPCPVSVVVVVVVVVGCRARKSQKRISTTRGDAWWKAKRRTL